MPLSIGYRTGWHLENEDVVSSPYCWRIGLPDTTDQEDFSDAALMSRPFHLPAGAQLTFWHRIDAEEDNEVAGRAWDGGLVMISANGLPWCLIEPDSGYPCTIGTNPDSPLEGGTPCFSGTHEWEQVSMDLSPFSGVARLLFRFSTDAWANGSGWLVDDIVVTSRFLNGDVDGDEELTILDLVTLRDCIIGSHPGTSITCGNADFNKDSVLDIADCCLLVDYLYGQGVAVE
jgi:hypothetical protein